MAPRSPAGFVAGTRVHTVAGTKPIERIAAGDVVVAKARGGPGALTQKRVMRAFAAADQEVFFLSHAVPEGGAYREGILVGSDGVRLWVGREVDAYPDETFEERNAPLSVRALHEALFERIHGDTPPMDFEGEMRDGRSCRLGFLSVIIATAVPDVGIDFDGSSFWYSDGAWGVAIHFGPDGPRVKRKPGGGYEDMYIGLDEVAYEHLDPDSTTHRTAGFPPLLRPVFCLEIEDGFGYYAGDDGLLVFGA